jgi:hypothetical protein
MRTGETEPNERPTPEPARKPDGPFAAALLATGIGCFLLGLLTTLAEASGGFRTFLNFYNPVGPLSGKTTYAVVLYAISWAVLYYVWKGRDNMVRLVLRPFVVLTLLGLLGTFPIFFELFAPG